MANSRSWGFYTHWERNSGMLKACITVLYWEKSWVHAGWIVHKGWSCLTEINNAYRKNDWKTVARGWANCWSTCTSEWSDIWLVCVMFEVKNKTFYRQIKPNQKSKPLFYILYHSVSDAVIKRLQPLLSHDPFPNSKPLGFISLYFPFEDRHLLPPETLSLAQHPFQYWLILKFSIPGQKSTVMNHGGCAGLELWWTMVAVLGLYFDEPWWLCWGCTILELGGRRDRRGCRSRWDHRQALHFAKKDLVVLEKRPWFV